MKTINMLESMSPDCEQKFTQNFGPQFLKAYTKYFNSHPVHTQLSKKQQENEADVWWFYRV